MIKHQSTRHTPVGHEIKWRRCWGPLRGQESAGIPIGNGITDLYDRSCCCPIWFSSQTALSSIGCITDDTSYIDIIFCLNLTFFYFLYSLTLLFSLKHVVSPIRLRLHVTKEVPLPPYFSIAFVTLRTMFNLVGGRVKEVSIVNNAKLFW